MKNSPLKYGFFVLLILLTSRVNGREGSFTFSHLTIEDGLSQSTVFCILQDASGYMWFGTTDGLNRYDGYNFVVYNNNPLDSTSISGNSITELCEDKDGYIWIGTNEGILNRYDRKTDTFKHFRIKITTKKLAVLDNTYYLYPLVFSRNNNQTITTIAEDGDDYLWIGTWGDGLIHLDKNTGEIAHYFNVSDDSTTLSSNRITDIVVDSSGTAWVGTFGGGLNKMIVDTNASPENRITFKRYQHNESSPETISDDNILSLFIDANKALWIGTFTGGLNKLNLFSGYAKNSSAVFEKYLSNPSDPSTLTANTITSIIQDQAGTIWVGTFGSGLNEFHSSDNTFAAYRTDPFDDNSLSDNDVLSLFVDRSGVLWIGTHLGKGISKLERNSVKFGLMQRDKSDPNSLNDDVVWSIYEDTSEVLWIGTYRGGVNKYEVRNNKFSAYKNKVDDENSISNNHVRSIAGDSYGNLWIGTYAGGLNRMNKKTGDITRFLHNPNDPNSIGGNQIQSLYIDEDNICWIGTFGGGLNYFDLNSNYNSDSINFHKFVNNEANSTSLTDNRVYIILPDSNDVLWLGTFGGGLNKFYKKENRFISYRYDPNDLNSLSNDKILSLFKDSEGTLWIGTNGGGLNRFNSSTNKFERYGENKGFNTQVIYGILEDNDKNLWISTNNGILKYSLVNLNIIYYNLSDGLQSMEFSGGAYLKNSEGKMFFGGINGINHFYPDSVKSNTHVPPIVISEFKIFNEKIYGEFDEIEVSYDQNFITIEYSALDYTEPRNNLYAHYLEGLEDEWIYTDSKLRSVYYTNLEPGTYIFHAKGSNSDGVWNQQGLALTIEILPPFWKTWWFVLISIFLLGSLVSFLISMKVKHLLAIEKLKVRLAADLHDNVGAGLTEISILSELATNEIKSNKSGASEKLDTISDTARHLVDSMSDIVWFVNPKRDSLHDLVIRLKDSYADLLSEIGVSFKTNNIDNIVDVKIPMDIRQNLYLIFKEGINNCIKHSKCKKINLETRIRGNVVEMILRDDGVGIADNNGSLGNGLRNMSDRATAMGGDLKIDTSEESGTTIRFIGRIEKQGVLKFLWS